MNFRQRALNVAVAEIKRKTHLNIILESLEQAEQGRVTALIFAIKTQAAPNENVPSKTNQDVRPPALIGAGEKGLDLQVRLYDAGRSPSMPRSLSTHNFELTIRLALSARQ